MAPDNPFAFPQPYGNDGMTLREWFAGKALAALRIDQAFIEHGKAMDRLPEEHAAVIAFGIADAMLACRAVQMAPSPPAFEPASSSNPKQCPTCGIADWNDCDCVPF